MTAAGRIVDPGSDGGCGIGKKGDARTLRIRTTPPGLRCELGGYL